MLKNSVNMATGSLTIRNDPRILPMGKSLRKTKINELQRKSMKQTKNIKENQ